MNTMPLEADTRVLIDTNLKNLGWVFSGKEQNVFLERPKTDREKKNLKGKRPDYVLYSKDGEPLIIIEAKRKGRKIDDALQQGIHYADSLGATLVFATDGVFCKSFHTKEHKSPLLNGNEVDELIRESLALRFLNNSEVNTISPKVQYDRKELIKIFDEANNILRGDGLRAGTERFGEFANILFLKLISENEQIKKENGEDTNFDNSCSWESIKKIPITARIEYINQTVYKKLNILYNTTIFTPLTLRNNDILKEIMEKLDPLVLTDVDSDIKGDAFEFSVARKGVVSHGTLLFIVLVVYPWISELGFSLLADAVLLFLCLSYIASIAGNLEQLGVPIPAYIKNKLAEEIKSKDDSISELFEGNKEEEN